VEQGDTQIWKNKRNEWAQSMWFHRNDVYGWHWSKKQKVCTPLATIIELFLGL
jgi:hypothetical protein